jgi:hypothetical protein
MAADYEKLLNYIVAHQILSSDSRESELDATASRDIDAEIASVAEDRRNDAQRLSKYFVEGMRRAVAGGGHLVVDDTDPQGNGIADAFARFLVTTNLATSESTAIAGDHYRYKFDLDMARLNDIAGRAGVQL